MAMPNSKQLHNRTGQHVARSVDDKLETAPGQTVHPGTGDASTATPDRIQVHVSQPYTFAQAVLRGVFFDDPTGFVLRLAGAGNGYLRWMWNELGRRITEDDPDAPTYPSDSLSTSTHDIGAGITVTVVKLPPPVSTCDAYLIALVTLPRDVKMRGFGGEITDEPRYFLLEASNSEYPFLCERSPDGNQHCNHGSVAEPTVKAFLEKLAGLVVR